MTQVRAPDIATKEEVLETFTQLMRCLLYTSDAADEL